MERMSRLVRRIPSFVTIFVLMLWASALFAAPSDYYLDCSAPQNGAGTQSAPWNNLASVDAFTFHPGDHLFMKRGTTCDGVLSPLGSGSENASIVVDAYGSGALPAINGGDAAAALKLFNQQYWEVNNLEVAGGNRYGVFVSGDTPNSTLSHIYLRNLDVHGAKFESKKRADSGEVVMQTEAAGQVFQDILVDGVKAHDSHVSEGIFVTAGGKWIEGNGTMQPLGRDVTVQNSLAHDVYGDGILISELHNGLLQHNTVYRSGLCKACTGSTPVGLWEWYCKGCVVQFNESYENDSWDIDGGDFDIDYYNEDNVVQYNYGHDSAGYCVAIFGAGGRATRHSIFRYNICSNNGRKSSLSSEGEIYLHTWEGGTLDGVEIYNNTIYWNPAANAAAFTTSDAQYSGRGRLLFENNIIYATVPNLVQATEPFHLDNNLYWTTASSPSWKFGGISYSALNMYQSGSQQDLHAIYANPRLVDPSYHRVGFPEKGFRLSPNAPGIGKGANLCAEVPDCSMGSRDFWGAELPKGTGYSIGADQVP
jgi:hypothetical protein